MDECDEKNAISLSWGRREIRISGEGTTLYVNGVPHDMTMMLEAIRGAGARPERMSPARWISLLRGRPTVLPGCESPLDRKSTRLNSSHANESRMPSSA